MVDRPADNRSDSDRRPTRREVLGVLGAVTALGLAGCSGGGDGGGTDPPTTEPTPTETTDPTPEPTETPSRQETTTSDSGSEYAREEAGEVEGTPDGLDIVGWTSTVDDEDSTFSVEMVVRNAGGQATETVEYTYRVTPYDDGGSELAVTAQSLASETRTLEPGATTTVTSSVQVDDPTAVAGYEIVLTCEMLDAGVYCE